MLFLTPYVRTFTPYIRRLTPYIRKISPYIVPFTPYIRGFGQHKIPVESFCSAKAVTRECGSGPNISLSSIRIRMLRRVMLGENGKSSNRLSVDCTRFLPAVSGGCKHPDILTDPCQGRRISLCSFPLVRRPGATLTNPCRGIPSIPVAAYPSGCHWLWGNGSL
jgi:hypothetical protein